MNSTLKLYSGLIIFCILCGCAHKSRVRYNCSLEEFKDVSATAMQKIGYKIDEEKQLQNDEEGYQYFQDYDRVEMKMKAGNDETFVLLESYIEKVPFVVDSVINQELNKDYGNNQLKPKSYFLFNLLTILSPGIGGAYLTYENPYFSKNAYLGQLFFNTLVFDALYIWGYGTGWGKHEFEFDEWTISWIVIWRVVGLLQNIQLGYYNKLAYSGYSFYF